MRASINEADPGFFNCGKVRNILFNNELVGKARCVTVDEETGEIEIFRIDDDGKYIVDPETGMRTTIVLKGQVEIITTYH